MMTNKYEVESRQAEDRLAEAEKAVAECMAALRDISQQIEAAGTRIDLGSLPTADILEWLQRRELLLAPLEPLVEARRVLRKRVDKANDSLNSARRGAAIARARVNLPEINRRSGVILGLLIEVQTEIEEVLSLWAPAQIETAPQNVMQIIALRGHVEHVAKALSAEVTKQR